MRTYSVHIKPADASEDGDAVLLREGFSWLAFLVPIPWALWHGMWLTTIVLVIVAAIVGAVVAWLAFDPAGQIAVAVGYGLVAGLSAPDWRRRSLTRRGYVERGVVVGRDRAAAEFRFLVVRKELLGERPGPA